MLRTQPKKEKINWKDSLSKLIFTYNYTRCEAFHPFISFFARTPRLSIDIFCLTPDTGTPDHREYMWKWQEGTQETCEITKDNARHHDCKVRSSELEQDCILGRNLTTRGVTDKLRSHRDETIPKVVRQVKKDAPVYKVKAPEQGKGRDNRILHHNLLRKKGKN